MKSVVVSTILLLVLAPVTGSGEVEKVLGETVEGAPSLQRIDAMRFAPGGVLLVADGRGARIVAIETGDTEAAGGTFAPESDFLAVLSQRMGVEGDDLSLIDMEVNPASGRLWLAVRNQKTREHVLVKRDPAGELALFSLENVTHADLPLPCGEEAPVGRITDMAWADGRLVAAARCNEEFASKIFLLDGPLSHGETGALHSAETYHVSHRRWETKAPMNVLIPYEENGRHYIVGAFSCTPIVKYPIDAIEPGAKIRGSSMIELGSGNRPLDMMAYEKNGEPRVLTNTFRFHHEKRPYGPSPHLAFRFDQALLQGEETVNENATRRIEGRQPTTDRIAVADDFHGVVHASRLDGATAVALREDGELVALALP